MAEFKIPEFLLNHTTDDIHARMKELLPADLDVSEGSHAWNFTRPTALVAAELCEFIFPEIIKLIYPEFAYGEFLDWHAKTRAMERLEATKATGEITITGEPGLLIPAGSLFATVSINEEPSVTYETVEEVTIPEAGSVKVRIQCTEPGVVGNTTKNTIILVASKLTGITAVTNEEAITGGTEQESNESLQARIVEYDRTQGQSFVGNIADYKRWATSVDGVGAAIVIPANDDTGLVTIILIDANGAPATEELCTSVYNYIMRPDDEDKRLAPVNAYLSVIPPETLTIGVRATVELLPEATMEAVQANFMAQLALYIPEALEAKEIKYTRVGAILSAITGVNDYRDLQIGLKDEASGSVDYGVSNIPITSKQLPIIEAENLILTAGTV